MSRLLIKQAIRPDLPVTENRDRKRTGARLPQSGSARSWPDIRPNPREATIHFAPPTEASPQTPAQLMVLTASHLVRALE